MSGSGSGRDKAQVAHMIAGSDRGENTAERRQYYAVPYNEPDGRVTFALQEVVARPGYYLRHLVSFHPTHSDAMTARAVAYRKAGIDHADV